MKCKCFNSLCNSVLPIVLQSSMHLELRLNAYFFHRWWQYGCRWWCKCGQSRWARYHFMKLVHSVNFVGAGIWLEASRDYEIVLLSRSMGFRELKALTLLRYLWRAWDEGEGCCAWMSAFCLWKEGFCWQDGRWEAGLCCHCSSWQNSDHLQEQCLGLCWLSAHSIVWLLMKLSRVNGTWQSWSAL